MNLGVKKVSIVALLFLYACIAHKEAVSGQENPYEIFLGTWQGSGTNSFGFSRSGELSIRSNGSNHVKLSMVTTTSGRNFSNQGDGVVDGRTIRFSLGEASNCSATLVDDRTLNFECQGYGSVRMTMHKDHSISEPRDASLNRLPQDTPPNNKEETKQSFSSGSDQSITSKNQSNTATTTAARNQSGNTPSNCPPQVEITRTNHYNPSDVSHPTYIVLPNGKVAFRNYPNESFREWGTLETAIEAYSNPDMGEEYRPVAAWARCHLAAHKGNSASSSTRQAQINVGNASEVNGRKEGGKSSLKRGDSQATQSQSQQESDTGEQGSNGSPKAKYVSKDATHCVELVPKGFKCDGPYDRFLTNICMTKISVRWRLGSDPWGMQELAPKGCTPVSPFRDQRGVQFKACSWDPKASHGPYSNPCRY